MKLSKSSAAINQALDNLRDSIGNSENDVAMRGSEISNEQAA